MRLLWIIVEITDIIGLANGKDICTQKTRPTGKYEITGNSVNFFMFYFNIKLSKIRNYVSGQDLID